MTAKEWSYGRGVWFMSEGIFGYSKKITGKDIDELNTKAIIAGRKISDYCNKSNIEIEDVGRSVIVPDETTGNLVAEIYVFTRKKEKQTYDKTTSNFYNIMDEMNNMKNLKDSIKVM